MTMLRHPLSGAEYHRIDINTVRVISKNNIEGVFTRGGYWVSGKRRSADPAMCKYVADAYMKKSVMESLKPD